MGAGSGCSGDGRIVRISSSATRSPSAATCGKTDRLSACQGRNAHWMHMTRQNKMALTSMRRCLKSNIPKLPQHSPCSSVLTRRSAAAARASSHAAGKHWRSWMPAPGAAASAPGSSSSTPRCSCPVRQDQESSMPFPESSWFPKKRAACAALEGPAHATLGSCGQ